jgi:NAD(P)-dependent dehydrogenase (short-subunit alcohol dehydrogenase family)
LAVAQIPTLIIIIALELGEHGITVNGCAPGLINTQLSMPALHMRCSNNIDSAGKLSALEMVMMDLVPL